MGEEQNRLRQNVPRTSKTPLALQVAPGFRRAFDLRMMRQNRSKPFILRMQARERIETTNGEDRILNLCRPLH
jgi:hypothetical protein